MIANGCCGDVSTRFYRESSGKDELERVSNEIIKQMNHLHKLNYSINTLKTSTVAKENASIHNRYNIFFIMIYPPFILSNKIIMGG